jgi:hypothetical protein
MTFLQILLSLGIWFELSFLFALIVGPCLKALSEGHEE